ncbi:hypothetical protein CCP3SC15_4320003 [Gammaproteobacteria bacterium]
MTLHQITERRKFSGLEPDERVRQRICRAIVTIHAEGRYYDGLDLLCEIVGWGTFRNELYPEDAMTEWLSAKGARRVGDSSMKIEVAPPPKAHRTRVCKTCRRQYVIGRLPRRKYQNPCAECGRGRRRNG